MPDLIRIKGGSGKVPLLQDREIAYSKDEKAFYIGTPNGNLKLCCADDIERIVEISILVNELKNGIAEIKARLDALESE